MKVYITKYALTAGISEVEAELTGFEKMISVGRYQTFHKPDWHLNKEDAVIQAEEMRIKKIKSIQKQLSKLEKLKF